MGENQMMGMLKQMYQPGAYQVEEAPVGIFAQIQAPNPADYLDPAEYYNLNQYDRAMYWNYHRQLLENISEILNNVIQQQAKTIVRMTIKFMYFPPIAWVVKNYASMINMHNVKPKLYTAEFEISKDDDLFSVFNNCIQFSYSNNKWHSGIQSENGSCFTPHLPPSLNLGFLMELRLLLQTLVADDFYIEDVAEKVQGPKRNIHDGYGFSLNFNNVASNTAGQKTIPISPFKLLRGEQETVYEKFGFASTGNIEGFLEMYPTLILNDLVELIGIYENKLKTTNQQQYPESFLKFEALLENANSTKDRLVALCTAKDIGLDPGMTLQEIMVQISDEDEFEEQDIDEASISAMLIMIVIEIIKYKQWDNNDWPAVTYNFAPSEGDINYLEYNPDPARVYPQHFLLRDMRYTVVQGGAGRKSRKTRRVIKLRR